jgi:hypothetical protein
MTRSRWIVALVSLFIAWTLLVGWLAAHWGGVYARGRIAAPIREFAENIDNPATPDLKLVAFESKALDGTLSDFKPRFQNRWGDGESGQELTIRSTKLADDGLQIVVSGSNGFSSEGATIDLLHGPDSSILARAEVRSFYDGASEHSKWERPGGWILVNRRDWSAISAKHPLLLKFHLVDSADPYGNCVSGLVRVPQ